MSFEGKNIVVSACEIFFCAAVRERITENTLKTEFGTSLLECSIGRTSIRVPVHK